MSKKGEECHFQQDCPLTEKELETNSFRVVHPLVFQIFLQAMMAEAKALRVHGTAMIAIYDDHHHCLGSWDGDTPMRHSNLDTYTLAATQIGQMRRTKKDSDPIGGICRQQEGVNDVWFLIAFNGGIFRDQDLKVAEAGWRGFQAFFENMTEETSLSGDDEELANFLAHCSRDGDDELAALLAIIAAGSDDRTLN